MSENISMSRETAEKEFRIFEEYYEIEEFENEDQRAIYDQAKSKVVKAIQKGRVTISEVDGDFQVVQTTKKGVRLVYREVDGRAKMEMDKSKSDHGRMYALLGALSKDGPDAIAQLKGADLSNAESLGALFLAV
jgi:hypothetical protein